MGVVNRFSNPNQPTNRINPISFEELAYAPTEMRRLHDQTQAVAAENAVNQADTLSQDQQLAQELYAPVEQQFNDTIDSLAKSGFSHDKKDQVIALLGKKKRLERDFISKLEARATGVREKIAAAKEFFKDNPEAQQDTINRIMQANSQAATNTDGNFNVPGVQDVFQAKILSQADKLKIGNLAVAQMKAITTQMGIKPSMTQNLTTYEQMHTFLTKQGVSADDIASRLETSLGRDVVNSFKMEAIMDGYGGLNGERLESWKDEYVESINNRKASIENSNAPAEYKVKAIREIDRAVESINNMHSGDDVVKYMAGQNLNKFIRGEASALAYETTDIDRIRVKDNQGFHIWKSNYDKEDLHKAWGLVNGGAAEVAVNTPHFISKYGSGFTSTKMREQAIENLLEKQGVAKGNPNYEGLRKSMNNSTLSGSQNAISQEVANMKKKLSHPENDKKLLSYIKQHPQLADHVKKNGVKATIDYIENFYKNLGQNYSLIKEIPVDVNGEKFRNRITEKVMDNFHNTKVITKSEDGSDGTMQGVMDEAGYADDAAFRKNANFRVTGFRFVPGQGIMYETRWNKSGDNGVGVGYVEPDVRIKNANHNLIELTNAMTSGESSSTIPIYQDNAETGETSINFRTAVPDFKTGKFKIYDFIPTDTERRLMENGKEDFVIDNFNRRALRFAADESGRSVNADSNARQNDLNALIKKAYSDAQRITLETEQ